MSYYSATFYLALPYKSLALKYITNYGDPILFLIELSP